MADLSLLLVPTNPAEGDAFTLSIVGASSATGKTITLDGLSIAAWVTTETASSMQGTWGAIQSLGSSDIPFLVPKTLSVVDGADSGTLQVTTLPKVGYDSLIVAGIDAGGIFQDDSGIAAGWEMYGHAKLGGPVSVDNYGRVFGASPWQYEYWLRNPGTGWSGPAVEAHGSAGGGGGTPGDAPVVEAAAAFSKTATDQTSHTITLPTKVTGEKIIAIIAVDEGVTVSWPTGWTSIGNVVETGDIAICAAERIVDGIWSDTTVQPSTSTGQQSIGVALAVSGAAETGTTYAGNVESATVQTIDPTSISMDEGNYLVIAIAAWDQFKPTFTATPTDYDGAAYDVSSSNSGAATLAYAYKQLTAASSEDPSAFTHSNTADQAAAMVILIPAATVANSVARLYAAMRMAA